MAMGPPLVSKPRIAPLARCTGATKIRMIKSGRVAVWPGFCAPSRYFELAAMPQAFDLKIEIVPTDGNMLPIEPEISVRHRFGQLPKQASTLLCIQ